MVQQLTKETTVYKLDWENCRRVARTVCYEAGIHWDDKGDFIQDVLVEMMERARRDSGGLPIKEMWRAARCVRSRYWRTYKKAREILSLDTPVRDTTIELSETVADDKALDLDAWLDAKLHLEHLPPGIVALGKKLGKGDPLTEKQRLYLSRFRKGETEIRSSTRITDYNRYHRRRAKGLCVTCGKESGKFSHCPECQEMFRVYQKKYRNNKGQAWTNTLRDYWRKQGRCPRCGVIPEPGYKTCSACRAKNRKYTAACALKKRAKITG
jgi:hypothetical protein